MVVGLVSGAGVLQCGLVYVYLPFHSLKLTMMDTIFGKKNTLGVKCGVVSRLQVIRDPSALFTNLETFLPTPASIALAMMHFIPPPLPPK